MGIYPESGVIDWKMKTDAKVQQIKNDKPANLCELSNPQFSEKKN